MLDNSKQGRELSDRQGGNTDRRADSVRGVKYLERRLAIIRDQVNEDRNFNFLVTMNLTQWNMHRAWFLLGWLAQDYEERTSQWALRDARESREVLVGFYQMVAAAKVAERRQEAS